MEERPYETIIVSRQSSVTTVTLNRPEKRNAANSTMWAELGRAFEEVLESQTDRVLVLRGAGGAFCSGADLTGLASEGHPLDNMQQVHRVALTLHQLPKPSIALVDGDAVGAGCNLALGCDMVFATPRSRFAEIFVRRALSVDFGGSWLLPRLVGLHKAKQLCLTGALISAHEAAEIGLINEVVDGADIDSKVYSLAEELVAGPQVAQALIKQLLNAGSVSSMAEALDAESAAQSVNLLSPDAREARAAFVEKRSPRYGRR